MTPEVCVDAPEGYTVDSNPASNMTRIEGTFTVTSPSPHFRHSSVSISRATRVVREGPDPIRRTRTTVSFIMLWLAVITAIRSRSSSP